jgi:hypothetical protein
MAENELKITDGGMLMPLQRTKVLLPKLKTFLERREMTKVVGEEPERWIDRLETEAGSHAISDWTADQDVVITALDIVPKLRHSSNPNLKGVDTLYSVLFVDAEALNQLSYE